MPPNHRKHPPQMTRRPFSGSTDAMAEITRLTRAGNLGQATARIQHMLGAKTVAVDPDVIEGEFTAVDQFETEMKPPKSRFTPAERSPLGQTLTRIAAGGMRPGPKRQSAQPAPLPDGATFRLHTYSGPQGSRDYWLFTPGTATQTPCPLVIMLHGCTQSPQDFATGTGMNTLAAAQGVIVAYPAQPAAANMNKCWNWFRPTDQHRDAGEPAILAGIARDVQRQHNADPAQTYAAGLSAGAAAAVVLAQAYPDIFAAIGVHSGLPAGAARDVPQALQIMRTGAAGGRLVHPVPTIVFHGTADQTVALKNGQAIMAQAQAGFGGTIQTEQGGSANGRTYSRTTQTLADGRTIAELWQIDGAAHAWSGGHAAGSYTDPAGPDASAQMLRFFAQHRRP